jgi:transposase-like protein
MPVGIHIDQKIKEEIVAKIRDTGMSVTDASKQYNIHNKTIYGWLKSGVVNSSANLILEVNRLRKENEQLYGLLGRATAELKHPKR